MEQPREMKTEWQRNMRVRKQAHSDHAKVAAFWHGWLAQLGVGFISRAASGVVGMLCLQTRILKCGAVLSANEGRRIWPK
jgi:hypothetical protein